MTGNGQGTASSGSSYAMVRSSDGSCSRSIRYEVSAGSVSAWKPCAQPAGMYSERWLSPLRSKDSHCRNVGDAGRRSTTTSKMAPAEHRTSLFSPAPTRRCSPRMTPLAERDMLSWTNAAGSIPASRATSASKVRLKNPRRSMCGCGREDDESWYRHRGRLHQSSP